MYFNNYVKVQKVQTCFEKYPLTKCISSKEPILDFTGWNPSNTNTYTYTLNLVFEALRKPESELV